MDSVKDYKEVEKQATDPCLPSENWALNMEICDLINETEDGPKDAMKAIRKRLSQNATRNFNVIMYTLTVLETCVKNCHRRFIVLVCNKEFVQEMVKLIGPKNDPPAEVQQKVLSLIQSWADAFKQQPELNGVVQVYNELKQKGVEFPMTDLDAMAPIHTPQKSSTEAKNPVKMSGESDSTTTCSPSTTLNSEQLAKLTSELRVVEGNMTVLSEMLSELVPGKEPPGDLELLKELYTTCQAMQERLVELISQLSNDEITAELLRVNDGLNNLFLRYSRYEKNKKSSSKERERDEGSLIDLNDGQSSEMGSVNSQLANLSLKSSTATSQLNSIPSVIANNNKGDEFDMFAQSRNITYESSKQGGSSYEANKDVADLASSLGAAAQARRQGDNSTQLEVPDLIGMHLEQDFVEMAAWLGEKQQEESLTSSEFERFLAERAAAADAMPSTLDNNSSTRSKRPNKEDSICGHVEDSGDVYSRQTDETYGRDNLFARYRAKNNIYEAMKKEVAAKQSS